MNNYKLYIVVLQNIKSLYTYDNSFNYFIRFIKWQLNLYSKLSIKTIKNTNNFIASIFVKPKIKQFHKYTLNNINYFYHNTTSNNKTIILFFHGGGYAFLSSYYYFNFLDNIYTKLNNKEDINIITIDYLKTPEYTYPTQINSSYSIYQELFKKHPKSKFIFMGDSAGSNLIIELVNKIIINNDLPIPVSLPVPICMIALSPWIINKDINPIENNPIENNPDILNHTIINKFKNIYINDDPTFRSTITINFTKFPPILIRYGENELFKKDIELFIETFLRQNSNINSQEIENMPHSFDILYYYYSNYIGNNEINTKDNLIIEYINDHISTI
jgi:acetyl esterase/lipase